MSPPGTDRAKLARRIALVASTVGIAGSVWMLAQYLIPPSFGACPLDGGCQAVRACRWLISSFFLPPLGILGFTLFASLATLSNAFARRFATVLGIFIGISGLGLVLVQATVCRAFCPFCVVVDASAITVGVAALTSRNDATRFGFTARVLPFAALGLAAAGSAAWARAQMNAPVRATVIDQLPPALATLQVPGSVTVVDVFNFACPHCRAQRPRLTSVLTRPPVPIHVRYVYPVPNDASRAGICSEDRPGTEAMIDDLFASQPANRAAIAALAVHRGFDATQFSRCLDSPATDARLANDRAFAASLRVASLPSIFVGHERFEGVVPPPDILRASILREAARSH